MKFPIVFILLATFAMPVMGAKPKPKAAAQAIERNPDSASSPLYVHGSAAMIVGGGNASPGVGLSLSGKLFRSSPIYFGVDSGMFFYTSPFALFIPVLASAYYKFQGSPGMTPVLGLALGPTIGVGSGVSSGIDFAMFFKPGIEFRVDPHLLLFFDARLGLIGSTFCFFPHLGAIFPL